MRKFSRALSLNPEHDDARVWLPKAIREQRRIEEKLLEAEASRGGDE